MLNILMTIYVALLFVLLTPGVVVTLPGHSSRLTSAVVHGLIFAVLFHFTHKFAMNMMYGKQMHKMCNMQKQQIKQ
jgi:hypothetical protein